MAVLALGAVSACSQAMDDGAGDSASAFEEAIINGTATSDARYAAVGALVFSDPSGVLDVFCSGTLVGQKAIVTARHCTASIDLAAEFGVDAAFAIGPDAFNPTQLIPITDYVAAPSAGTGAGLLLDGGRDVAVVHLASAPAGIRPVRVAQWDNNMLSTRFQIAGFGISSSSGFYGQKFVGLATARAIKGRWYELLFKGDYQAYRSWYFTDSPSAIPSEEQALQWWNTYKLETNYELLAGGLKNEAVSCHGDSGGPLLLGTTSTSMATYGVSFAGEDTISTRCGLGGGYLVFNGKMLEFVKSKI
jgi:hypothetical protein